MADEKKPKQEPGKRQWRQDDGGWKLPDVKHNPNERKQELQPPKPFPKPAPNDKAKTKQ